MDNNGKTKNYTEDDYQDIKLIKRNKATHKWSEFKRYQAKVDKNTEVLKDYTDALKEIREIITFLHKYKDSPKIGQSIINFMDQLTEERNEMRDNLNSIACEQRYDKLKCRCSKKEYMELIGDYEDWITYSERKK